MSTRLSSSDAGWLDSNGSKDVGSGGPYIVFIEIKVEEDESSMISISRQASSDGGELPSAQQSLSQMVLPLAPVSNRSRNPSDNKDIDRADGTSVSRFLRRHLSSRHTPSLEKEADSPRKRDLNGAMPGLRDSEPDRGRVIHPEEDVISGQRGFQKNKNAKNDVQDTLNKTENIKKQDPPVTPGQNPTLGSGQDPSVLPGQNPPLAPGQDLPVIPGQNPPLILGQNPAIAPGQNLPVISNPNPPALSGQDPPALLRQNFSALPRQDQALPGQNPPALPEQDPLGLPGQDISALPRQNYPALPGQDPLALPRQDPAALPEQSSPALPRQNQALPGQDPPALAGQDPTALPTQDPPALSGQDPSALPGRDISALPGQNSAASARQNPAALPRQNFPAASGQDPPALPGQNPALISGQDPTHIKRRDPARIPGYSVGEDEGFNENNHQAGQVTQGADTHQAGQVTKGSQPSADQALDQYHPRSTPQIPSDAYYQASMDVVRAIIELPPPGVKDGKRGIPRVFIERSSEATNSDWPAPKPKTSAFKEKSEDLAAPDITKTGGGRTLAFSEGSAGAVTSPPSVRAPTRANDPGQLQTKKGKLYLRKARNAAARKVILKITLGRQLASETKPKLRKLAKGEKPAVQLLFGK